jgi:hypothetical protein
VAPRLPSEQRRRRGFYPEQVDALDALAEEGRQVGRLGRPISDCPAKLDEHHRRAWRAGWRHGHEWLLANRRVYEAGVRAYGRGAPRRVA